MSKPTLDVYASDGPANPTSDEIAAWTVLE